jgi:hypothetical protein
MKSNPRSRSAASAGRIFAGSTISVARSRK